MKLTKTSQRFKGLPLSNLLDNDIFIPSLLTFSLVSIIAAVIWFGGPYIAWDNYLPFVSAQKRFYVILVLYLLWTLKLLILDLDYPQGSQYKNTLGLAKLDALEKRFRGALKFLKRTSINQMGKPGHLDELPWYLLMGPAHAGKTSLLANADINYVLQRQFKPQQIKSLTASDDCDWWVTKEATIIDIPSHYLEMTPQNKNHNPKLKSGPILWDLFLRLTCHHRGEKGIHGILIAIPLNDIFRQEENKKYQAMLSHLFKRINELENHFEHSLPVYLIITKCDQVPGFAEFFAESSTDEIAQAWGVMLPKPKRGDVILQLFGNRLNALIKKLNQQLLWRLHQERNPMMRPPIKDFPLQVERLKENILDWMKKFNQERLRAHVKGVYFTSSLQEMKNENEHIIDEANTTQHAVQLFEEPAAQSRAYFIKQLLTQGIALPHEVTTPAYTALKWKQRAAFAVSVGVIVLALFTLGKDFKKGVRHTYAVQTNFSDYEVSAQQFHDPNEHLQRTIALLNSLQQAAKNDGIKFNIASILSFYSQKSKQKTEVIYRQALQNILLPEIRNYLGDYLKDPINKNSDDIYAALESYLMLGDYTNFDMDFLSSTLNRLFANTIQENDKSALFSHLALAIKQSTSPISLDENLINDTRKYLLSLQYYQLGFIILKNTNGHNVELPINLGTNTGTPPVFQSQSSKASLPIMYTAKGFQSIVSRDAALTAQEILDGNWVLGYSNGMNMHSAEASVVVDQIRNAYITSYIQTWEALLNNIHLAPTRDLAQADATIAMMTSTRSPLLQLINTLHENTYFEPVASNSQKLASIALLAEKNQQSQELLYQIFTSLQALHNQLQAVINADNPKKAAFEMVSKRMINPNLPDVITQARMIADKSPEPVKSWMNQLTNNVWKLLLSDASKYIDLSWQDDVARSYANDIANRFPFNSHANKEVSLNKFTNFFGTSGALPGFYAQILQPFVDTTNPDWRWKTVDGEKLPFSDESIRQIQHAMKINRSFFPDQSNKLSLQFSLQPFTLSKGIKSVKLNIDDNAVTDSPKSSRAPHIITWPGTSNARMTRITIAMNNQGVMNRDYPGDWGWFKLVNQSFESAVSRKQMVVNFSMNNYPAKYILITDGQFNPFMSMNLNHFRLPEKLIES